MGREHDELFAKQSIQLKLLTPAQVMECREVQAELESAGIVRSLAVVAVDQGALSGSDAGRLIDAINARSPGKHPPLTGKAAAPPAAPERRSPPAPPAPRPAKPIRKAPARPAPGAPPPRGSRKPLLIGGAGALFCLGVVGVLLTNGHKSEPPPKRDEMARVVPQPPPPPPPPPKEEAPPPQPKLPPKVEPKPEPESPPPPPSDDGRKAFEERLEKKKKEARARFEEAASEVAAERKATDETAKAAKERLAGKTVSLSLNSGESYKDAKIKSWNFHGADLDVGGKAVRVTWDGVQPSSLPGAADVIFDAQRPQDQFDRGRFFVARRQWKEARAAFTAAAKLGQGYDSRVQDFSDALDRLVTGQGGFHGSARRVGRDGVRLSWDFRDPKQLEDFSEGLVLSGTTAILESSKRTGVFLFGAT
ncbi:MAG TPA: hypothetical protein VMU54_06970, partial [Planctomycetota bacterium]|nr:hypothetical protein [Planctomycetota bacterium]